MWTEDLQIEENKLVCICVLVSSDIEVMILGSSWVPSGSNMAGWKIPNLNGGFNRKITYKYQ